MIDEEIIEGASDASQTNRGETFKKSIDEYNGHLSENMKNDYLIDLTNMMIAYYKSVFCNFKNDNTFAIFDKKNERCLEYIAEHVYAFNNFPENRKLIDARDIDQNMTNVEKYSNFYSLLIDGDQICFSQSLCSLMLYILEKYDDWTKINWYIEKII